MSRRLIEVDPDTGAIEEFEYNDQDETFTIHRTADVGHILEANKRQQNESQAGDKEWVHVARIPIEVQYVWWQQYGIKAWDRNHADAVKRLLNSNEWRYLRVNGMII